MNDKEYFAWTFSSFVVHNTNMNNINMIKVKEPAQ